MKEMCLYIMILILFVGCVHESNQKIIDKEQQEIPNAFLGSWESIKRSYPYKSQLSINNDSTFYFEYGACIANGFSKGKWELNDSLIVLNSFKIDSCMYLLPFGIDCIQVNGNDSIKYIIEKTVSACNPQTGTNYVEFYNEEFYIVKDILKHRLQEPKQCPEIRNDFKKILNDTTGFNQILPGE